MKDRICFLVQRYGLEVNGGSELYCRQFAEKLTKYYDVDVVTTKAIDYMTWKDEYKADREVINHVNVIRFGVRKPRDPKVFDPLNHKLQQGKLKPSEEQAWVDAQGPLAPECIKFVKHHIGEYKAVFLMTYLYYLTVMGIKELFEKAILIPTAHEEPFLNMAIYRDVFVKPKAIVYNTDEERELVFRKFDNASIRHETVGIGVDLPEDVSGDRFKKKYDLDDYMIYVGRIDSGKGCDELFKYFIKYKKENHNNLKLVLMGKPVIKIPDESDIISLGFVSDEDKFDGMAGARFLILPSKLESLSMVVLESFGVHTPVIVNGLCDVLKGHCLKSNAGLYYTDYPEFEATINYMLSHKEIADAMGENGKKYVDECYDWDEKTEQYRKLIEYVGSLKS